MPGAASRLDVLVVGAGPTGLTLGLTLAAWGVPTRVVDRQLDRVHESRALAIQPRTVEVLGALGLAAPLLARGNDAVRLQFHAGGKVIEVPIFDTGLDDTRYPFLLFLSQAETEAVLSESLAERGLTIERGTELVGAEAAPDRLTCTLRHPDGRTEQVSPSFLVGCDGAHSTVRHQAGIGFAGSAYPQTFVLADLEVDGGLDPAASHFFPGDDGVLLFFPLRHPASWRILTIAQPDPGAERPTMDELQAIVDKFTGGSLRLRDPFWLTYFKLHQRLATSYRAGAMFLAGDAAHVHSPAGGQGMNTGIQDAWNLGWKLALVLGGADLGLLDSYQAERQPVGRFVLRLADAPFRVALGANRVPRLVRTRLVPRLAPLASRVGPVRRLGFRIVSELGIRYRGSPLSVEGRPRIRTGPRAGDRVPDGSIERGDRPSWLHDALAGPRLHLLLSGPVGGWDTAAVRAAVAPYHGLVAVRYLTGDPAPPAGADGDDVLRDPDGGLLHRLGRGRPAQYLVRPDGHIGYRCAGTDFGGLSSYLTRWLPPRPAQPGA